ncbi:Transposase-associated domain [Sesbania bispinosa]|nr:Transposase-associated domain [Sesbania bispinosa]
MDKSWIDMPRNTYAYLNGLDKFLDFAFEKRSVNGAIRCPCPICHFNKWQTRDVVHDHLICKEFPKNYKESLQAENPVLDMINDAFGINRDHVIEASISPEPSEFGDSMPNEEHGGIADLEQIEQVSQTINSTEISSNDALAEVLGPDHSGRVRGLGLGGLHSVAFGSTSMRFSGISCGLLSTYSAECSYMKEEVNSLKTKLAASEESVKILKIAMLSYIQMKEGHIPIELGALLGTPTPSVSKE